MANHLTAFLDTMVFLHYPAFSELPWCTILGATSVELVVAETILYELDHHKDRHPHGTVRKRAGRVLGEFERLTSTDGAGDVAPGITIRVLMFEDEPTVTSTRLSRDVPDDRLLLAALRHRELHSGANLVIVSNDVPMRLKARSLGLACIGMPDDLRHPDPQDEYQRQLASREEEIRRLRIQKPQLELAISNGTNVTELAVPPLPETREDYSKRRWKKLTDGLKEIAISAPGSLHLALVPGYVAAQDAAPYNAALLIHFAALRAYLGDAYELEMVKARAMPLALIVRNIGNGPATKVCVTLNAPDGVRFYDPRAFPRPAAPPEPPARPLGLLEYPRVSFPISTGEDRAARALHQIDAARRAEENARRLKVAPDGKQVRFRMDQIIQHDPYSCPKVAIALADPDNPRNFCVQAELVAAELPEPIRTKIHFRLPV